MMKNTTFYMLRSVALRNFGTRRARRSVSVRCKSLDINGPWGPCMHDGDGMGGSLGEGEASPSAPQAEKILGAKAVLLDF